MSHLFLVPHAADASLTTTIATIATTITTITTTHHYTRNHKSPKTHPKGKQSFGDWYIEDLLAAANYASQKFGTKRWLGVEVYTEIHQMAFSRDAVRLGKRNGYRTERSGVYLPVPDKPLGVFHDIHINGTMNYDPKLRKMEISPYNGAYDMCAGVVVGLLGFLFSFSFRKDNTQINSSNQTIQRPTTTFRPRMEVQRWKPFPLGLPWCDRGKRSRDCCQLL